MVKRPIPKPLNHKPLRRLVNQLLDEGFFTESSHTKEKHPTVPLAEVLFGLLDEWTHTDREFDAKSWEWKYTVHTTASNGKWLRIAFVPDEKNKLIRIITRFQDESKEKSQSRLPKPLEQKKGNTR